LNSTDNNTNNKGLTRFFPALEHFNIPNAITTLGLVMGIFVCYFLTQQDLRMAIIFLFFAGVMDAVDGFVAAKLNQQTIFGKHVDTLVDFFTCCIVPIWMVHDLLDSNSLVVVALIFYCMCGLWRLARYNITEITEARQYFTGLPVPGAMSVMTVTIWCVFMYNAPLWVAACMFFLMGLLMVSGIKLPKYGIWQIAMGIAGLGFLGLVIFS